MRSSPRTRQKNGHQVLPIIYFPSQSKAKRLLPVLVVCTFGFWIFALGALVERLPLGGDFPNNILSRPTISSSSFSLNLTGVATDTAQKQIEKEPASSPKQDTYFEIRSALESESINARKKAVESQNISSKNFNHAIPNVLIFTHAIDLLAYRPTNNITQKKGMNNSTKARDEQEELLALQRNIKHTIELHPHALIRFLTDQDCIESLQHVLGNEAPLIHYFQKETAGMYKADICRGAALWETGGLYLDADVGVRMPLWDALSHNTTFATSLVHRQSNHVGNFFQAFMAVTPRHAILERYLQLFLDYYQGNLSRPIKKGPLGVILLRQAFDDLIREEVTKEEKDYFRLGPKTLETRLGRIQIWQEVQYTPQWFPDLMPAPTWGTRRACHFVVVANRKFPLIVPLYSRIAGSRMCRGSPRAIPIDSLRQKVG